MEPNFNKVESHEDLGREIGKFVDFKNQAYQNSFSKVGRVLSIITEDLTGDEVKKSLPEIIIAGRRLDKMIRHIRNVAKGTDALGEDPLIDGVGYDLLHALERIKKGKNDSKGK